MKRVMKQFLNVSLMLLAGGLFLLPGNVKAQDVEFGAGLGGFNYQGDLVPTHLYFNQTKPGFYALYRYYYQPRLNFKASLQFSQIQGADSLIEVKDVNSHERRKRNLDFKSPVAELSGGIEFNFLPFISGTRRFAFTPYAVVGVGLMYFEPVRYVDGKKFVMRKLKPEGKSWAPVTLSAIYGLGIKYSVGGLWNIGIEVSQHFTTTDYLDGIRAKYTPDLPTLYAGSAEDKLKARAIAGYIDYFKKQGKSDAEIQSFLQRLVNNNVKRGDPTKDWVDGAVFWVSRTLRQFRCEIFRR